LSYRLCINECASALVHALLSFIPLFALPGISSVPLCLSTLTVNVRAIVVQTANVDPENAYYMVDDITV
jgi:hypothetical protein